jgi:DNA-binding CsgD family transcriptional regulator
MGGVEKVVKIASTLIIAIGVILIALDVFQGKPTNVALPLVFVALGGAFLILVFSLRQRWHWAVFLFVAAALSTAFGIILLINELTQDRSSWAYAWLFLVAAVGAGLLLANRDNTWPPVLSITGWGLVIGGITLFAVFGVIAGGLFIQVMAPILLIMAGVSLRWVRLEKILPAEMVQRLQVASPVKRPETPAPSPETLVEPLSDREMEVLRLINAGLSNQQIAKNLSVAPSTIKTHINNIYGKLGVQTRVQALNRARELKLLETG